MWLLCLVLAQAFEVPQLMSQEERLQFLEIYREQYKGSMPVYDSKMGFSVALTKDVRKGDCVAAISPKDVLTSRDPYVLSPFMEFFTEQEQLAVRVVYERLHPRDPTNYIREYVHSFPTTFDLPIYWTDADFDLLELHTLEYFTRERLRVFDVAKVHARLIEALEDVPNLPPGMLEIDMLKWGLAICMSRTFGSGGELMRRAFGLEQEKREYQMLMPVLDVVNHFPVPIKDRPTRVSIFQIYFQLESWICYKAQFDQKVGRHFMGSYGDFPNSRLVIDYGFALDRNPDDTLELALPHSDLCTGQKRGDKCIYTTFAYELNAAALKHFFREKAGFQTRGDLSLDALFRQVQLASGSKRSKLTFAALSYRKHILIQTTKSPVRTLKRARNDCTGYRCYLIHTYCIGQRLGRLLHVRQIERKLLGLLGADIL